MGIFVNEDYSGSYGYNDVALELEGYDGLNGRHRMMIEACQDDMEMFSAMINYDVAEIDAMREGGDVQAVMENALTDAFSKFKEFLKKVWAKVKALVDALIARISGFCAKDGKAFVRKYFTIAAKNVGEGRCKKIKFKIHSGGEDNTSDNIPDINKSNAKELISGIYETQESKLTDITGELYKEKLDSSDVKDETLKVLSKGKYNDYSTFKKDFLDDILGDLEEEEGIETKHLTQARLILESNKDDISILNKAKSGSDKLFKDLLRNIDREEKNAKTEVLDNKTTYPDDEKRTDLYSNRIKFLGCNRTVILAYQDCCNTLMSAIGEMVKAMFVDSRKVLSLAASATVRKANESFEEDFMLQEEAAFAVDYYMA